MPHNNRKGILEYCKMTEGGYENGFGRKGSDSNLVMGPNWNSSSQRENYNTKTVLSAF